MEYVQSEDNCLYVGPGDRPQVGRLGSKCPYLPNHLTGPLILFYSTLYYLGKLFKRTSKYSGAFLLCFQVSVE